jgi:hypothetical protein
MRLRRKAAGGIVAVRGLSPGQRFELVYGVGPMAGEPGFSCPEEYQQAWQRHRDSLLAQCAPWHRPDAYWSEIGYQPRCGNESEESVLLRLGLPLTPTERAILSTRRSQALAK